LERARRLARQLQTKPRKADERKSQKNQRERYEQVVRAQKRKGAEIIPAAHPETQNIIPSHGTLKYDLCNPAERERLYNQIFSDTLAMNDRLIQTREPAIFSKVRIAITFSAPGTATATKLFRSIETLHSFLVVDVRSPSILLNAPDWSQEGLCGYEKTITMGVAKFGRVEYMSPEQIEALSEDERAIVETKAGFKGFDNNYARFTYKGAQPGEFDDEMEE
jgi:hypothetical protein